MLAPMLDPSPEGAGPQPERQASSTSVRNAFKLLLMCETGVVVDIGENTSAGRASLPAPQPARQAGLSL
jgi:hypothetical protein